MTLQFVNTLECFCVGFLYTLNASTLNKQWDMVILSSSIFSYYDLSISMFRLMRIIENSKCLVRSLFPIYILVRDLNQFCYFFSKQMGPVLEKTVASFRLLPPTENYVPPYKDPWRFW